MKFFFNFLKKYSFFIGLILFIIIISRINLGELFRNIKIIKISYLGLAVLLILPMIFLRAWRWNYLKKQQGILYNLKDSFLMYSVGIYIGLLTPGKLGEVTRALYLKKDDYSLGKSLVSAILDRISDFAFLLIFAIFGTLFFLSVFQKQILILVLGILIFVFLFILSLKIGLIKWVLNKIFYIFIPKQYQKSWKIDFQDFINDLKIYKLKHYLTVFLLTAFSWLAYYLLVHVLARGINITNISFLYLAISLTLTGFITLLPVSILGIGTRDGALILLFAPFLISTEQIVAFSSLVLLISLITGLIGLICWFIKPIRV